MSIGQRITRKLSTSSGFVLSLYAITAAFSTYSCMYAFRKPFSAASYDQLDAIWGLSFKSAIVIAQVIGYTISKFIGIKVVSEMGRKQRGLAILVLIGIAEAALLGFALVPVKMKFVFLFLNGIPLGMVWGLVFSFLEGRRYTEVMGAGLCASFIFASGFVKSVGSGLISVGIPEVWMPVAVGAIFIIPLIFFVTMLGLLPDPTKEDEELRTKREPMSGMQRKLFFKQFAAGLSALIVVYIMLTAFRDFRDNFMDEILTALGYGGRPEIFTMTEIPVTIAVLVMLAFIMFIKSNMVALTVNHFVIGIGCAVVGVGTWAYQQELVSPIVWVMLTGFGAYMAYIPFNCILFERLIAAFKYPSNAGFLIYLADAFGYLGSVAVLFYKDFFVVEMDWLTFFTKGCYILSFVGVAFTIFSLIYFERRKLMLKR